MNSKENYTELSRTSTFWKELDSMSPSHVRSRLENLKPWKDRLKSLIYRQGRESTPGIDPEYS